ncbi:MAG: hypothetical protein ISS01_01785 [Nanoarchaeota archaeon]|nr:hypothetical protein [Nanoarchaeota archaeon]
MVRKFSRKAFVTSLLITLMVFVAGLFLGWNLDNIRTDTILENLKGNELDAESLSIEQSFWEEFGGDNCQFAEQRLNLLSSELVELGQYLNSYTDKSIFEEAEYEYLARRYFLLEIQTYILVNHMNEECQMNNSYILFFYGEDDIAIDTLKLYYDVTDTPTMIINNDIKREGYVSYEELKELIDADFV